MSENWGSVVAQTTGIRCESYPDECAFAMQAGVFDGGSGAEAVLRSLRPTGCCPTCGSDLESWEPQFPSVAPGRPGDW
ncbi:hypothetical protein [Halorientalis sp.]|uniref:hypothetical protein n=1 Tax=Halorientalis sp. TaxID=1931229 RepID=UPI0026394BEE|nr:hypothetical protein [Halorientalis sp.]